MLKGLNKITSYLNKGLKDNDFECTVRPGTDFCYYDRSDTIEYAFVVSENANKLFVESCKKYNKNLPECDPFIISFFHELGHYETQGVFSDREGDSYYKLCTKLDSKQTLSDKDYFTYFNHPIEYEATAGAIDYIINNESNVKEGWLNLQPLIIEFYNKNKVEDL